MLKQGCAWVHQKWHQSSNGAFSAYFLPQTPENKEKYNLEYIDVLPECSYVVPNCIPLSVQECSLFHLFVNEK